MMSLASSRVIATSSRLIAARAFSTNCAPAEKLREIISEYRKENFSREIPSRFKKELLQPYVGTDGAVEIENLNKLMSNIGHPEGLLSSDEQRLLLEEAGSSNGCITVKKMMELID